MGMKICVYAICKNESQFVDRWMDSMSEADLVVVLDTGSTDDTVEKLRARGAQVETEEISPWRFDVARNRSLELVPEDVDICVCTDLDEVFVPGWRKELEKAWKPTAGQATYHYTWSFNADGSEGVVFWIEKMHARHGYQWTHPVHEILSWVGEGQRGETVVAGEVRLEHYPDATKSRAQYLPLLELSVKEDPQDDRNMHYLGREYLYRGQWQQCIDTLKHHLKMQRATWIDERCASMRYIAQAYLALGNQAQARCWYLRAVAEAPHLREPWLDFAKLACACEDWYLLVWLTGHALAIRQRPKTYITESDSWGSLPYDLASLGYYYLGKYEEALERINGAIALTPNDERLLKNRELILQKIQAV